MKKSIFKKFFTLTAVIILISFTIFGAVLMIFSRNLWLKGKNDLLMKNVHTISDVSAEVLGTNEFQTVMTRPVDSLAQVIGADIFIVDSSGNIVVSNHEKISDFFYSNKLPQSLVSTIINSKNKEYKEVGNLGGMYSRSYYMVGVPLNYHGSAVGAVVATVPAAELTKYMAEIFRIIMVSALLALFIAFIAVYYITSRFTRPLRAMAEASQRMAKGDFMTRIPVESTDEIGELALSFNNMTQSLASLEQMRRSFISNVSHELKTPMTTISGFIDGILDGTITRENQSHYLTIVSDEVKRLSRLVNSMLQLSKFEQGETKLKISQFNLTETVVQILLSFEQKIGQKEIEIKGVEDLQTANIDADCDLIHQVIYNLLDNAIKFTPQKGYIELGIKESEADVSVSIKNSGEGISGRDLSHIFDRFFKTDRSRGIDKTGVGLGLNIVKTILDIHGGKVIARSVEGEYTEFEFTIPKGLGQNERV